MSARDDLISPASWGETFKTGRPGPGKAAKLVDALVAEARAEGSPSFDCDNCMADYSRGFNDGAAAQAAAVEAVLDEYGSHDKVPERNIRTALTPDAARKHDAAVRAIAWADVADALEAVYPTDIWPEGNETTDRIGASMGRANARFIRHYAEQRADAEEKS